MDAKQELIELFGEMAILLDLAGENAFKVRAFDQAQRALEGLPGTLTEHFGPAAPAVKIAGIGKGLIEKIHEFLATGAIAEHRALRARFPSTLFELLRVQGLGPKKVKLLYQELGIDSLAALEAACQAHRVQALTGFGAKTEANLLSGIAAVRRFQGHHLQVAVRAVADQIITYLQEAVSGARLEVAGSLRRGAPVVRDLDLLAVAPDSAGGARLLAAFTGRPGVQRVLQHGERKAAVLLAGGLQIDLRLIDAASFGAAWCYFTGSKAHNTRLRGLARDLGLKLNEYGLTPLGVGEGDRSGEPSSAGAASDDGARASVGAGTACRPCATEADVFRALGLPWIPPELREDLGEIELAREGRLPELITAEQIVGAAHCHTHRSDGSASAAEMAAAAKVRGWRWLAITDHSRSASYAGGLTIESVHEQWREIDALARTCPGIVVLRGIESDILADGGLDYPDEVLAGFELIIASVHSQMKMSREAMTRRLVAAAANPFTCVLGHLTGRVLLERDGYDLDHEAVLDACIAHDVAIEINAEPRRLDIDWSWLRRYAGSPLKVMIGPDAHHPDTLAQTDLGVTIARKGMVSADRLLNTWSVDRLRQWLSQRRERGR